MLFQLLERNNFAQLFKGAETARHCDERVGYIFHPLFALTHGFRYDIVVAFS